ncbi:hypothetical protein Moror_1742 [Moniliophthora roreri MCA 2997]|uniref:Uncharacterized protein n=1 Tax=Moniliophthora roreri (strain MCA 2997) TaxID=1381753 RepID=V2XKS9_MONRO|nr:hypothetical protein Moror_1742 [Moniliophthora roreri MCA 2997]
MDITQTPSPRHSPLSPSTALPEPVSPSSLSDSSSDSSVKPTIAPPAEFVDNGYNKLPTVNAEHISLKTFGHATVLVKSYLKHKRITDDYKHKSAFLSIFQSTRLSSMLMAT